MPLYLSIFHYFNARPFRPQHHRRLSSKKAIPSPFLTAFHTLKEKGIVSRFNLPQSRDGRIKISENLRPNRHKVPQLQFFFKLTTFYSSLIMISPTFSEFKEKLKLGNLVPVWAEVLADFDTPVSALRKIESGDYAFLLESVEGGEKWGRYSFLGTEPSVVLRSKGTCIEIVENGKIKRHEGNPIDSLRELLSRYHPVVSVDLPRFHGGAVGYFGYDIVRFIEKLPEIGKDELGLWDSVFMITDSVLVFDNINHKIKIISNAYVSDPRSAKRAYTQAMEKIETIIEKLRSPVSFYKTNGMRKRNKVEFKSNFEPEEFMDAVRRTKEYIQAGDIIQAVISQRWKTKLDVSPFDLYRALRVLNPSPYMFYLKTGEDFLVGSSPEVMVRVEGNRIETRPIAGTRPRGRDEKEDNQFERELLADPKERAEHIMLVTLQEMIWEGSQRLEP